MNPFTKAIDSCIDCNKCLDACPVTKVTGDERLSPKKKIELLAKLEAGEELEKHEYDNIYLSTVCGACEDVCPVDIPITEIIRYERGLLAKQGKGPARTRMITSNMLNYDSPRGETGDVKRLDWVTDELRIADSSETAYMAGCWVSFSQPLIAKSTIKVFNKGGIEPMVLKEEKCCGLLLIDNGMLDDIKEHAKEYVDYIESLGIKRLITSCPGCYHVLSTEYPKLYREINFEVIPSIVLFKQLIDEGKIEPGKLERSVSVRDACVFRDIEDIPRYILSKMGVEVSEMFDGEHMCCGGPAGLKPNYPEISSDIAMLTVKEYKNISDTLVSYCPFCMHHIGGVCKENGEDIDMRDISELLAESLS